MTHTYNTVLCAKSAYDTHTGSTASGERLNRSNDSCRSNVDDDDDDDSERRYEPRRASSLSRNACIHVRTTPFLVTRGSSGGTCAPFLFHAPHLSLPISPIAQFIGIHSMTVHRLGMVSLRGTGRTTFDTRAFGSRGYVIR